MTDTEPFTISAETLAEHLRWMLSNRNSEIDIDGGPFLDVAFNADCDGNTVSLSVSMFDADNRRRGTQSFTLSVSEADA